ncbi:MULTISPECIES: TetR family transcriptional regulator C-terminal domain-containing protein [unclassified Pseudodesulfovibrio]|uniref:TetR family transcriptional regulator C-terminal domain-containing protein n=1 Tax=unclassified Pseudodesulfovibrio TaxID=2661612 RepID=UPI000FEBB2F6|nr:MULTISPECIES: TetR family transcriptional regulator C-terminal domain-containing protein [unclassified Pseudodesulfovibrio]MCJ2164196.1 TetR/AcrR family transcriptional regulator [Pseudodesulfovibrio sp. S3-i]RWU05180.1 TetR family transcriptional regulator [Pseudodesulfovibrio sp. S3]
MSEDTKQRLIEAGAELVHQRGFNNTGLKDILQAAGVPKGSFYFYFDNKETFGIEMVDYYGSQFRALIQEVRRNASLSPLEQVRHIFAAFQSHFKTHGYTRGCPIGNLAQEMGDLSKPFREKLLAAMDGMIAAFASILDEAKVLGEIPTDLDSRETAIFMVEAWHGAIIRMKVTNSPEPLELFSKFIFEKILK